MKILMLVNWKVEYVKQVPANKQPPDYFVEGEAYWFFRYFSEQPEVDVVDISSFKWLENFEKNKIRFYIWQTLRVLPNINQYDLIISHGMQSGVMLSLFRCFFKTKAKHVVFDIGSFNSAAEKGFALKLMQFASKSIDQIIYHTSRQIEYYEKFFPWLVGQTYFIRFGTDLEYFSLQNVKKRDEDNNYMICVGYAKRDWDTLIQAYRRVETDVKLRLVGHVEEKYSNICGVEQIPFVSIEELMIQIYNAKFCILPLDEFNYSYGQMTLMQQMALEKCVLAADVSSLKDYGEDNKTVIFYRHKEQDDLVYKMRYLLHNNDKVNEIGKEARQYLLERCNEKIMAADIEKVINNMKIFDCK